MPALGSDKFAVDPAGHSKAFLHFVEILAPVSRDVACVLRIDDHNGPLLQTSGQVGNEHVAVWSRNVLSINRTAFGEAVDKRFFSGFDGYKFDESGSAESF